MLRASLKALLQWLWWFPLRSLFERWPHRWMLRMGSLGGGVLGVLLPGWAHLLTEEFRKFPEWPEPPGGWPSLARTALRRKYENSLETVQFPRMNTAWIARHTVIRGEEHLQKALGEGRGALVLVAHLGPNQMSIPMLGSRGYRVNQIGARPHTWHEMAGIQPTRLERAIFDLRLRKEQALPATFLYLEHSMRPAFRRLEQNEVLIMAFEGRAGQRWERVPVLGRTALISLGPLFIARRVGAAVLPAFLHREEGGKVVMELAPPLPQGSSFAEELTAYGALLGEHLLRFPDQYGALLLDARRRAPYDKPPLFEDAA